MEVDQQTRFEDLGWAAKHIAEAIEGIELHEDTDADLLREAQALLDRVQARTVEAREAASVA